MSRVLSIARLLEARCQGLFTGLIAAQRKGREEIAKKKKYHKEREEMRLELTAAQADIAKVTSTLESVRQQYGEQQQELYDEKIALGCLLEDERITTRELRQNLKKAEATIAYLNTRLSAIESGSRGKDAVRNDLQLKLTAAAAAEATSATKWERERQQLRDEIDRARQERDDALATIRHAKTEEEEYQRWRSRLAREDTDRDRSRPPENLGSPSNRPISRSLLEDTTPVRGQPSRHPAAAEQRALGADTPMSPRAGTSTHRGSRDKPADDTGTAITAIAQSMLTGPPVALSSAHLTGEQVSKWIKHQRTQLEARTFDARTLTTTISEQAWRMIGFKIASSRTLRDNPSSDWKAEWNMDTFLKALEEVYSLEPACDTAVRTQYVLYCMSLRPFHS